MIGTLVCFIAFSRPQTNREVEILMQTKQQLLESGTEMSEDLKEMLKSMEAVLYATTEGFELPMNEGEAQTA